MKLTLGFSPCPNDTFIFDALVNRKIVIEDFEVDVVLADVQQLNSWAYEGKLDVTKLSLPAVFDNHHAYSILQAGAALGKGVGPLLVSKERIDMKDVSACKIAIPGQNTTANFLLSFAFPDAKKKVPMLFSQIEDAVLNGDVDLGVIIHENRFTYQERGLVKICDLGEVWEQKQNLPIPLGCIAIKKTIPQHLQRKVDMLIKQSVEYAWKHYPFLPEFVTSHAQEMNEDVMRKHIELYVNDYTTNLGAAGMNAINKFFQVFNSNKSSRLSSANLFLS